MVLPTKRVSNANDFRTIGHFRVAQETGMGRVSNFNQLINGRHHIKNHVEIGYLAKFDAFQLNRDQVMDLETWFKIHTNVSNFETVFPKTI